MRRSLAFASIALVAAILAFWGAMAERGSAEGERVGHSVCMDAYGVYLRNSISPRMLILGVADWVALACVAMALPN
jgi:hypothetical protein